MASQLVRPILSFVVVGASQISFAVVVLTRGWDANWFVIDLILGMGLNMALIVYSVTVIIAGNRDLSIPVPARRPRPVEIRKD